MAWKNSACARPISSHFEMSVTYMRVRTTSCSEAPAFTSAASILAQELYDRLNCKGIVRADFILEEGTGKVYFLEVNTMPGQSENSLVPQQVRAAGLTLRAFYGMLIEGCLAAVKN